MFSGFSLVKDAVELCSGLAISSRKNAFFVTYVGNVLLKERCRCNDSSDRVELQSSQAFKIVMILKTGKVAYQKAFSAVLLSPELRQRSGHKRLSSQTSISRTCYPLYSIDCIVTMIRGIINLTERIGEETIET